MGLPRRPSSCRPFAGQAFELLAEVLAGALSSVPVAHVEEGEVRDSRPDVRSDNPDPHELPIRKRSQRNSTCGEMALALGALVSDRVLALPSGKPCRRAEIAEPSLEPVAVLHGFEQRDPSCRRPTARRGGEPVDFARTIASHGVAELPPNRLDLEARVLETTLPIPHGARTIQLTERRGSSASMPSPTASASMRATR
jgi:hypothetical protein